MNRVSRQPCRKVPVVRSFLPHGLFILALAVMLFGPMTLHAAEAEPEPEMIGRVVAVEGVCAWPNLTLMRDGTVVAIFHNRPSHGQQEGDVDCWASRDGLNWEKRSTVTQHEPDTVRMNHAAGLAKNGDLVVLCSGWTNVKQPERPKQAAFRDAILRSWVLRSEDGGRTWEKRDTFPEPEAGWAEYVPFGDIWAGRAACCIRPVITVNSRIPHNRPGARVGTPSISPVTTTAGHGRQARSSVRVTTKRTSSHLAASVGWRQPGPTEWS